MRRTVSVRVPAELRAQLDGYAESAGLSRSDVVREAVRDYLCVRRFRALSARMVAQAAQTGVFTDQDVFDRAS